MMREPPMTPSERLEALLDGRLSPADAAAAQREFARETRLQDAIDAALRGQIVPPAPDRLLAKVRAAHKSPIAAKARPIAIPRWLAVAACILVLIGSAWGLAKTGFIPGWGDGRRVATNPRRNPPFEGPSVIQVHEKLVAAGYEPRWPTEDARVIASTVWSRLGQGLAPSDLPSGAKVLGISQTPCLSPDSLVLLMKFKDKPLSIIVDKLENDRLYCVSAPMDITPFRREVGALVIYEVTPLGKPLVYDKFTDPKQSDDWYKAGGGF
jgi:hypothetical protein